MENCYARDMTKGNELSLLLRFTLPMVVGNVFQQFYNMADSIIVGRFIGANALGAVGEVGSLNFLLFSLCMGLGSGVGILTSQYIGAGRDDYVKKIVASSIYITLAAGLLMSLIGFFGAGAILRMMNTPAENFADAFVYTRIVCGGTLIVAGYNTISSILRAFGDARTPLVFLVTGCLVNIVLDLVFVLVFHMGVAGAAWATVIAQVVSMAGSVCYGKAKNPYLKLERRHYKVDKTIIAKSCRIGLSLAGQNALIAFSCVALQSVVNRFGTAVMAAYTATSRVEQLVQQPYSSLETAVSTFTGQNVGAGKYDRVYSGYKKSVWVILIFSLSMMGVILLFAGPIVGIFVKDPDVARIGATGLRIAAPMYFFLGLIYITRGMLNGVGDAAFAMINGVTEVAGRLGFAFALTMIPFVGMWGVWWTNCLTWTLTSLVNLLRVRKGTWKRSLLF